MGTLNVNSKLPEDHFCFPYFLFTEGLQVMKYFSFCLSRTIFIPPGPFHWHFLPSALYRCHSIVFCPSSFLLSYQLQSYWCCTEGNVSFLLFDFQHFYHGYLGVIFNIYFCLTGIGQISICGLSFISFGKLLAISSLFLLHSFSKTPNYMSDTKHILLHWY